MEPIDPFRPRSIDELLGQDSQDGFHGGYGGLPQYRPYEWELPKLQTPEPSIPPFEEPLPEPEKLPSYEDGLMTQGLFDWFMNNLPEQ